MTNVWVWAIAAGLYAGFRLFYDNWRGKLTPAEIATYLKRAQDAGTEGKNDLAIFKHFLEDDDGREFVMLNLVRIQPGTVTHPITGQAVPARDMLMHYSKHFIRRLMLRGGHPAIVARKAGGYFDAWQVPPDPGWTIVGFMRYRSRRDLAELATDTRFKNIHAFKSLGTAETFSFPTTTMLRLFIGPRLWVGLVLALAAALAQIMLLTLK